MAGEDDIIPVTTEQPAPQETVTTETPAAPESVRDTVAASMKALSEQAEPAAEGEVKPGKLADRERDERGRVLPKKAAEGAIEKPKPESEMRPQPAVQPAQVAQEKPAQVLAPRDFSIKSKAAWGSKIPTEEQWAAIKQDIATKEENVEKGFKDYEGIKQFAERAKHSGTTLAQALSAYTGIEDMIHRDMPGGLLHIMANARLTQHEAGQVVAQLAHRLGLQLSAPANINGSGGSPADSNAGADPSALMQILGPVLSPLQQEIATLKTSLTQRAEADRSQRMQGASSVIETFRSKPEHKYYDNVEETIGDLLESGVVRRTGDPAADLAKAYEIACWQNPEIREHLISERDAKARQTQQEKTAAAQRAAVSIRGAPQGSAPTGSNGSRGNVRDDVAAAFASLREQV
jgi:hypothetical protein